MRHSNGQQHLGVFLHGRRQETNKTSPDPRTSGRVQPEPTRKSWKTWAWSRPLEALQRLRARRFLSVDSGAFFLRLASGGGGSGDEALAPIADPAPLNSLGGSSPRCWGRQAPADSPHVPLVVHLHSRFRLHCDYLPWSSAIRKVRQSR